MYTDLAQQLDDTGLMSEQIMFGELVVVQTHTLDCQQAIIQFKMEMVFISIVTQPPLLDSYLYLPNKKYLKELYIAGCFRDIIRLL